MRLGAWSQALAPGFGFCYKCRTPWKFVKPHYTTYEELHPTTKLPDQTMFLLTGRSCFPLCEKCWEETPVEERLPYYAEMFTTWKEADSDVWEKIAVAVKAGL